MQKLIKLNIVAKLLTLIPIILFILTGWFFYSGAKQLSHVIYLLTEQRLPVTNSVSNIKSLLNSSNRYLWLSIANSNDSVTKEKAMKKSLSLWEDFKTELAKTESLNKISELNFDEVNSEVKNLDLKFTEFEVLFSPESANVSEVKSFVLGNINKPSNQVLDLLNTLELTITEGNFQIKNEAASIQSILLQKLGVVFLFALILLVSFSTFMFTALSKKLYLEMKQISKMSGQSKEASQTLKKISADSSQTSMQVASLLEESSAVITEIASTLNHNLAQFSSAVESSKKVLTFTDSGKNNLISTYKSAETTLQNSKKIQDLIGLIEDIAFQTNLLALNAAVESARAGEAGRGFAVVADAVRSLSVKSNEAAQDIRRIVDDSERSISDLFQKTKMNQDEFRNIDSSMQDLNQKIDQLFSAANESKIAIDQLSVHINEVEKYSLNSASLSEKLTVQSVEVDKSADVTIQSLQEFESILNFKKSA